MITRRQILRGAIASVAAPAIVRAELIMPVRSFVEPWPWEPYVPLGQSRMVSKEEMERIAQVIWREVIAARRDAERLS